MKKWDLDKKKTLIKIEWKINNRMERKKRNKK